MDDDFAHKNIDQALLVELERFYQAHPEIQNSSHGLAHAKAVHSHATKAIACTSLAPKIRNNAKAAMEIRLAALLHDVDDRKYFPSSTSDDDKDKLPNARMLCDKAGIPPDSVECIVKMIRWVGCSENGNSVPPEIAESNNYHLLIPRWSDRLEAVGAIGVVRCYQYNQEKQRPLFTDASPRANSADQVWAYATPDRFATYLSNGGKSGDMISHYYDKLLHIARPPPEIVRNAYLEQAAENSSKELVEVCVRLGRMGRVDEDYILALERMLKK